MSRPPVLTHVLTGCAAFALLFAAPGCPSDDTGSDNSTDADADTDATDSADETEGELVCGDEWAEKDGSGTSIMDEWGAPCMADAECVAILGDGASCVTNILGVYDLPGGYCSKLNCQLPDNTTSFVLDAEDCSADGGIACVGVQGIYTVCAMPCDSHNQCQREGYGCRIMPNIGADGDPTFCLMDAVSCCTTESGECGE